MNDVLKIQKKILIFKNIKISVKRCVNKYFNDNLIFILIENCITFDVNYFIFDKLFIKTTMLIYLRNNNLFLILNDHSNILNIFFIITYCEERKGLALRDLTEQS